MQDNRRSILLVDNAISFLDAFTVPAVHGLPPFSPFARKSVIVSRSLFLCWLSLWSCLPGLLFFLSSALVFSHEASAGLLACPFCFVSPSSPAAFAAAVSARAFPPSAADSAAAIWPASFSGNALDGM